MPSKKDRLDEIEGLIDLLDAKVSKLQDAIFTDFDSRVAKAMQRILDVDQALTIRHYINGKEVVTKLIKEEIIELEAKQKELEKALIEANAALKRCKDERA